METSFIYFVVSFLILYPVWALFFVSVVNTDFFHLSK
jgi:hypothetical protein